MIDWENFHCYSDEQIWRIIYLSWNQAFSHYDLYGHVIAQTPCPMGHEI